jgi:hypothetical protein
MVAYIDASSAPRFADLTVVGYKNACAPF